MDLKIPDQLAVVGDNATDGDRTQELAMEIMRVLKTHLAASPLGPHRVYEALNAVAVNAAIMIAGSDSELCGELFRNALNANLELFYSAQKDALVTKEPQKDAQADQPGPTVH